MMIASERLRACAQQLLLLVDEPAAGMNLQEAALPMQTLPRRRDHPRVRAACLRA